MKNAINAMQKSSNVAKQSAAKAKQMALASHTKSKKEQYEHDKKKKKGVNNLWNKLKNNPHSDLPEEEQAYLKAQTNQNNYSASVMAANYEQNEYCKLQARFKRDCKGLEQQRLTYCRDKIKSFINNHVSYFNNATIGVLQDKIKNALDVLDINKEFDMFLSKQTKWTQPKEFVAIKYDYQNVFHSLQDSMDITSKLAPHSKLPLMLTCLCDKVRELNGFQTEG